MIEHVVLFKLKPEVDAAQLDWMLRETRIRLLKIPFVHGLRCGCNQEIVWPFFLLVELESLEKLAAYKKDPAHVRYVREVIAPHTTERLALDYQSDPGENPLFH